MANKNVAILSLMAQADNKSIKQAVNSMDKALQSEVEGKFSSIGDEIGKQFESAMNVVQRPTLKNANIAS